MLFGPRRCSFLLALALAARAIVVLIRGLFNCHGLDVGIRPLIKLDSVEADALFPDREFTNVRPDCFVEFFPAHAEVAVCLAGANEAREDWRDLGRASICHEVLLHAARGGRRWLFGVGWEPLGVVLELSYSPRFDVRDGLLEFVD